MTDGRMSVARRKCACLPIALGCFSFNGRNVAAYTYNGSGVVCQCTSMLLVCTRYLGRANGAPSTTGCLGVMEAHTKLSGAATAARGRVDVTVRGREVLRLYFRKRE